MTETLPPKTPQPDPAPRGEVTIERVTHHGMGRAQNGTLVPRALPGEVVMLTAEAAKIVTPSPERIAPPCRHFKACGGCAMQHASDGFVEGWKAEIVRTALRAQGLTGEIARVLTSPADSRRRARLAGRRTKKGALVGFHARASDTVIEVPGCRLLLPELTALIRALERIAALAASRMARRRCWTACVPPWAGPRASSISLRDAAPSRCRWPKGPRFTPSRGRPRCWRRSIGAGAGCRGSSE